MAVWASQSRAVLSWDRVKSARPSGLKATSTTQFPCGIAWPMGRPVARSHSRASATGATVPTASVFPSGLKARLKTMPPWAIGAPTGRPVVASQKRTVWP